MRDGLLDSEGSGRDVPTLAGATTDGDDSLPAASASDHASGRGAGDNLSTLAGTTDGDGSSSASSARVPTTSTTGREDDVSISSSGGELQTFSASSDASTVRTSGERSTSSTSSDQTTSTTSTPSSSATMPISSAGSDTSPYNPDSGLSLPTTGGDTPTTPTTTTTTTINIGDGKIDPVEALRRLEDLYWEPFDLLILRLLERGGFPARFVLRGAAELGRWDDNSLSGHVWCPLVRLHQKFFPSRPQTPAAADTNEAGTFAMAADQSAAGDDETRRDGGDAVDGARDTTEIGVDPEFTAAGVAGAHPADTASLSGSFAVARAVFSVLTAMVPNVGSWWRRGMAYFPVIPGTDGISTLEVRTQ